ncbi:MAG: N-acetylmuramoyl-L-alanine amidase [Sphingobacteriaceae bacterium]|nr:N-acetylmuramoyl-L-alanine amidase [Sphingobacteriaceae bacterium]
MKKLLLLIFTFTFLLSTAKELVIENPYSQQFKKAYSLYPTVPKGILEAVAYTQTRFQHLNNPEHACTGIPTAYGVMGLIENGKGYFRSNLSLVSNLSGFTEEDIKKNPETSIIACAAAYNALQQKHNAFSKNATDYKTILIELSELPLANDLINDFVINSHLYQLFWFLNNGEFQDAYSFPDYNLNLPEIFGENYNILSSSTVKISKTSILSQSGQNYKSNTPSVTFSPDYGPALWNPTTCNYSSRSGTQITAVAIHDVEGSYSGCISWFKNCSANASAHYVLRSSDGQVTQMILEVDKAWHIGSENPYTVGLEHEGYASSSAWYTNAMYVSSANLVRDICTSNSINPLRCYYGPGCSGTTPQCGLGSCTKIKGHQMYPSQTHSDPGPYWNWDKFYKLINNTYSITTTFTASTGNFYDSGGATGNYTDDERKVYLFTKAGATNITLNFTAFNLEKNWDHLFIYDGGNINSPLIGKYTGTVSPGPVTSTNDSLLVEFRSDCATTASGWSATYTTVTTATITPDIISPNTTVSTIGAWKTASFTATFSDADNVGGSGLEKSYYQVIDFDGTEWRANYTKGFFADNFDNAIHPEWTQKVGIWSVTGNSLVQSDEVSTAAGNTNIYAALTENLSNRYLYQFLAKFEGSGTNRSAGLHFFCDKPDSTNRNNSYFVWFRLDDQKVQIYKVIANNFGVPVADLPLAFTAGQWYDIKVIFDRISGKMNVYMNNGLIATWTDPSPYSNGGYISFRSGNCKFSIDEIKVYRSRAATANVTLGSGNAFDIRYQNPNPLTSSAKIKSICQDSAGNLSPIYYHDLNIDWTPPNNLTFVNDGKSTDEALNCNDDSLSANWSASADTNSAIVKYWYSVGTSAGATDIQNWTSSFTGTAVTTTSVVLTQNTTYYFNIQAENGAGLLSNIISSNGQKVDSTCAAIGINEIVKANGFAIYPNPFTNNITVKLNALSSNDGKITLTDVLGREVFALKLEGTTKTINTASLAQGVYWITIENGKDRFVSKLVKE